MKEKIHPQWFETTVTCACGNNFKTYSTKKNLTVEICSACHPFYSGGQSSAVRQAGQVEKFKKRYTKKAKAESAKEK